MEKLVGGFNTSGTSYRIYYNEETMKLSDSYGKEIHSLSLNTLLRRMEEYNLEKIESRYLIRQEKEGWFCECIVNFKGNIEVFIIAYGKTPEEAFGKCGGLLKD
jgi:hypothetical protein